jgi:hypothetical protein
MAEHVSHLTVSAKWKVPVVIIIIIIIIHHKIDHNILVSSCLIISSKAFQVVFVHLLYNSALFLASCCCSFLLNAVANLICIFSVSRQLVPVSILPKFLHSSCGQKSVYPNLLLKNFISINVNSLLSFVPVVFRIFEIKYFLGLCNII